MSTFSWLISRSPSLMATSGLLWESTLTGATLYLPATPPFSLTRSMAICAPTEEATDPPAANGPVRSYITPMRTVSASACARLQSSDNAAAAAAVPFSRVLRDVGITFLPHLRPPSSRRPLSICAKYLEGPRESQHGGSPAFWLREPDQPKSKKARATSAGLLLQARRDTTPRRAGRSSNRACPRASSRSGA